MVEQLATKLVLEKPGDPRVTFAATDVRRFAMLAAPLALLLVLFRVYSVEQPAFLPLAYLVFGGFAVSYWLPVRWKQPFLVLLSLGGAYVLLSAIAATLTITGGLLLFCIVRSGLPFAWKVAMLLSLTGAAAWARTQDISWIPNEFWPVFGAIFMFRTIIYMYEAKQASNAVSFGDFLRYFFLLPNYYFTLFPVIDLQTFRDSWLNRDIHEIAQRGVWWIFRGTTHLLVYRVIYLSQVNITPAKLPVSAVVCLKVVSSYLLYLRVSGQFHIIIGMLLLFGYDLPETHRRYFLAAGIGDLWRRINIYWTDFMTKVFYYPAYFKFRRSGRIRAQLIAIVFVFAATWFLHAYQFFWLQGKFHLPLNDAVFWSILCLCVGAEALRGPRPKEQPKSGWKAGLRHAVQVAATFVFMSILWSMWSAHSLTEWFEFLRTGRI